ncbi:hypothetical protein ACIBF1_39885 [Spirillospora sp. NPDC050679]
MKRLPAMLMTLTLALSACGEGEKAAPSPAPSDAAALKYARCLRDQGVDMPDDPKKIPQGGVEIPDRAMAACKGVAPSGKTIDMRDPAVKARFARFAKCMRGNGYDMPDDAPPDVHLKNPAKWEKASKACDHILREQR